MSISTHACVNMDCRHKRKCNEAGRCLKRKTDVRIGQHWLEVALERINAGEPEQEVMRDYGYALARTLLGTFADFLHELPDEDGWEVGPMQVKWDESGKLAEGPLWVGINDTRRWAEMFIQNLNTGGNDQ